VAVVKANVDVVLVIVFANVFEVVTVVTIVALAVDVVCCQVLARDVGVVKSVGGCVCCGYAK